MEEKDILIKEFRMQPVIKEYCSISKIKDYETDHRE